MSTAARGKEEELTARQEADKKTAIGRYDDLVKAAEEARISTSDEYRKKEYAEITKEKNAAWKDVQNAAKFKEGSINHKSDLDDLKSAIKKCEKACERLDEHRAKPARDVEALADFVEDWPLFKSEMPKTATLDFITGQVVLKANK